MSTGAYTPEELETLFEDAVILRDDQALAALFEGSAVLIAERQASACGGEAIARLALACWSDEHTYIANPQSVVQAHDIALIIAERAINVAHRGSDGTWRYAIALVHFDAAIVRPEPTAGNARDDTSATQTKGGL